VINATGYSWMLPPGAVITAGEGTTSILLDFPIGSSSGEITVAGTNDCGPGTVSPGLFVTVNPFVPENRTLANIVIESEQAECYDALNTVTVAGDGKSFIVNDGGSATLIAGEKIVFLPDVRVAQGGYMKAFISTDESYCGPGSKTTEISAGTGNDKEQTDQLLFTVYPNPTSGKVSILLRSHTPEGTAVIKVYSSMGKIVKTCEISLPADEITLELDHPGIYFVRLITHDRSGTCKIIRQ
jgi:hypothetical protein